MPVVNCTQVGGCPQAIKVTAHNGSQKTAIYNPQTQSYVVDPQSQSPDQPWDWGVIAKNIALWTIGLVAAGYAGLNIFGRVMNHRAAKAFLEDNNNQYKNAIKDICKKIENPDGKGFYSTFAMKCNEEDNREFWAGNLSEIEGIRAQSEVLRYSPLLTFSTEGEFQGLNVPMGFNVDAGWQHLVHVLSPESGKSHLNVLTATANKYLQAAMKKIRQEPATT